MIRRCPPREMKTIEALLFASGEPVSLKDMARALSLSVQECRLLTRALQKKYDQEARGFEIVFLEDKAQITTRPLYFEPIQSLYRSRQQIKLTDAQLEVLAIVAYKQPVTRQEVSDIRGVSSDAVISRLLAYGLVEEAGRLKAPGRPLLFKTSDEFLRAFGLESVKDLPALPAMEPPEKPAEEPPAKEEP